MTEGWLALIMDGLLLCFLAVAAFYAARLSVQLKVFRESRSELEKLVSDLSRSIKQAENSIDALRTAAQQVGLDLQDAINDARTLLDELQIIVESGEGIASRLEKRSSGIRQDRKRRNPDMDMRGKRETPFYPDTGEETPEVFSIRDPEFEDDYAEEDDFADDGLSSLHGGDELSKAERDLYHALHGGRKKRTPAGGV